MRCIFCKGDSSTSRSVEHIVPESLGGTGALPPGVVCDRCNNYFGRCVEGPLLDSGAFRSLRARQGVANKTGRIPAIGGVVLPDIPAILGWMRSPRMPVLSVPEECAARVMGAVRGTVVFPEGAPPADSVVSRFLAKCALEALAFKLLNGSLDTDELAEEQQFDELRDHARWGRPAFWPYSRRRIYDEDRAVFAEDGRREQTVCEYDLLLTHPNNIEDCGAVRSEVYFVLALFGLELAINMGGPETEGYETWLRSNGGVSPLYFGKNAPCGC